MGDIVKIYMFLPIKFHPLNPTLILNCGLYIPRCGEKCIFHCLKSLAVDAAVGKKTTETFTVSSTSLYRRNLAILSSPVKNNTVQFLLGVLLPCETLKHF
jgi:hypothetical protein